MASEIKAIFIDCSDATGIEHETHVFKGDCVTCLQGYKCLASLKGHRLSRCRDNADYIFVNRQAWVDVTNRKNWPLGIASFSEVKIAS